MADAWPVGGDYGQIETFTLSLTDPDGKASAEARFVEKLARGGRYQEAEALATSILAPYEQACAMISLAKASVAAGKPERARILASRAEALAREIDRPWGQGFVLGEVVNTLSTIGDCGQAETLARTIADPAHRTNALIRLIEGHLCDGDRERANALMADAESYAHAITDPREHAKAIIQLIEVHLCDGDRERANALVADAESYAHATEYLDGIWGDLVKTVATSGDYAQAETIARSATVQWQQDEALTKLVEQLTAAGEFDQAKSVAHSITSLYKRANSLAELVEQLTAAGELDQAYSLATETEALARTITDPSPKADIFARLVGASVAAGEPEQAHSLATETEALARTVTGAGPDRQVYALTRLVQAFASGGDSRQAEIIACSIRDPGQQAAALTWLAKTLAVKGHGVHSRRLVAQALAVGDWATSLDALEVLDHGVLREIGHAQLTRARVSRKQNEGVDATGYADPSSAA